MSSYSVFSNFLPVFVEKVIDADENANLDFIYHIIPNVDECLDSASKLKH